MNLTPLSECRKERLESPMNLVHEDRKKHPSEIQCQQKNILLQYSMDKIPPILSKVLYQLDKTAAFYFIHHFSS